MRLIALWLALTFHPLCSLLLAEPSTGSVGMLLPLSGAYASVGADNRAGVEAAIAERGGVPALSPVFADSQADPRQSVSEFRKLVDRDGVLAVYAMRGPVGMAINPLSHGAEVPLIGGVGNKDFTLQNQFAFQAWTTSEQEGEFLAKEMRREGIKRVAVVTLEDDWTVAVSKELLQKSPFVGLTVVGEWHVLPAESDFRTLIGKMRRESPDAIFVNLGLAQIGPFVSQLRSLGGRTPIYSNFWAAKPEVKAAWGDAVKGLRYVEMQTNIPGLPKNASGATLSAYVATHLIFQAAAQVVGSLTRESLLIALGAQREVQTAAGTFPVLQRRIQFPMVLREIGEAGAR